MKSLVFFGSLRSEKLLKVVLKKNDLEYLKIYNGKIFNSKLYKVKNENFPYLVKTNFAKDATNCIYIENLTSTDFKKILFYESIEYRISKITIKINTKNIFSNYFELIKKHKTSIEWSYEKWQPQFENYSCNAAKEWMFLFKKYKNNPKEAENYWKKILIDSKKNINF